MRDITSKRERLDELRRALADAWAAPFFDVDRIAEINSALVDLVGSSKMTEITKRLLLGEPAPERSALATFKPWEPKFDDGPIISRAKSDFDSTFGRDDDRRFTDKPDLAPERVRSLPINHAALIENRTLFPSTVVEITKDFPDRLLVSGKNNRKLGERIQKGAFKGYALYGLSLEERATCPTDCAVRGYCYGNGMQMARRHRIGDPNVFFEFLEAEIATILADPIEGLMVRLHVLGDFPSVEYVAFWSDMLAEHPRLACYGYTHRRLSRIGGDEIGDAIDSLKQQFGPRFRIRWSSDEPQPDGATVIARTPEGKRVAEGIVCPAQTDATASCVTCGLCWEGHAAKETIVFVKHGPKTIEVPVADKVIEPETQVSAPPVTNDKVRPIAALKVPQRRDSILSAPPEVRLVAPTDLRVEPAYQRDLSARSLRLIRKIVTGWDWAKFKAPICAETDAGLFIIDGQHTAIAAASHPEIQKIPVMIVSAQQIERRAAAFVSHNRDRLIMTPAQVFYGDVAAGDVDAIGTLAAVENGGGTIPRLPVQKGYTKPGQVTAVSSVRDVYKRGGAPLLERIIRIAVVARTTPIAQTVVRGLQIILTEERFSEIAKKHDKEIADALGTIKNIDSAARHFAADSGQGRDRACALLIVNEIEQVKAA